MKKVIFTVMLVMILGACSDDGNDSNKNDNVNESSENTQQENTNNAPNNNEDTVSEDPLDDVVAHFENDGFEIGEKTEKVAEMVGATDGFGIALDGTDIELYLYDDDSEDLEEIKENNEYDMDGFVFPALANGNIVIINYDEHPDEDDVVDAFNGY